MKRALSLLTLLLAACAPVTMRTITVPGAPKAIGPYSQGIVADGFVLAHRVVSCSFGMR